MRIKLVTFAPHPNFGTCLQSYALNYILRKLGHDVEFIYNGNEEAPISLSFRIKRTIISVLKALIPSKILNRIKSSRVHNKNPESNVVIKPYILELPDKNVLKILSRSPFFMGIYKKIKCKNLQLQKVWKYTYEDGNYAMRRLYTKSDYADVVTDADVFITGSDQIWNPFCGGFNPLMFLEFVPDEKKCISYSSSISQPEINPFVRERIKNDLRKFKHISVREQQSVLLLNDLLNRNDVRLVVDPTYLLSAEEWSVFGSHAKYEFEIPDKYIFVYFVGSSRKDEYNQIVKDVMKFTGIKDAILLDCYNRKITYGGAILYNDAGPYEWVNLLEKSSYVINDSFHSTVFALKFKKEFVHVLKNTDNEVGSQNTRMYDLLNRYNLQYKIYNQMGDVEWQRPVDYDSVTPIIQSEVNDSLNFLKFELEN